MKDKIVKYLLTKNWFNVRIKLHFLDAIENIQFNSHSMGCGLEDRNITDRYEAMEHGFEKAIEYAYEAIESI